MTANQSESIEAAWAKAWVAAWAELPGIWQGRKGTIPTKAGGSYEYNYAALPDILAVARPVLAKHGLAVAQSVVGVEGGIGVETRIIHEAGHIVVFGPAV